MRVLVIDDTAINLASAKQTLQGHEVVTCGTYDSAVKLIERNAEYSAVEQECKRRGIQYPEQGAGHDAYKQYREAHDRVTEELRPAPFDAVLVDLLMPAGRDAQGNTGAKYVGTLMPVGYPLALMAALHGAKYVGVMTATNHHDHPASATFDHLGGYDAGRGEDKKPPFTINGARVAFSHLRSCLVEDTTCTRCSGVKGAEKCYYCDDTGLGSGKDWGKLLDFLVKE